MKTLAIMGATGRVGSQFCALLNENSCESTQILHQFDKIRLFASKQNAGKTIDIAEQKIVVENLDTASFEKIDVALFAIGSNLAKIYAPKITKVGGIVVDNSSLFRYDDDIPLIVPEVNVHLLNTPKMLQRRIIANPNCSTAQLVLPLHAIDQISKIKRIIVSTYQSASGAGKKGEDQLRHEVENYYQTGRFLDEKKQFDDKRPSDTTHKHRLAFNVIPQIDLFLENGYTREEMKIVWETKKILGRDDLEISATAVRVPVFRGHSEAVTVDLEDHVSCNEIRDAIENMPGCCVLDDLSTEIAHYPTPHEAAHNNLTWVGRIRQDTCRPHTFHFWVVSDNLRKGAAYNSLQIISKLTETL